MQINYHIGANCTDGDRLLKSLMRNVEDFARQGIALPGPGRYRKLLLDTVMGLNRAPPAPDTREVLLDAILDGQQAQTLILSNSTFLCHSPRIFEGGRFYPMAQAKIDALRLLFPQDRIALFIALRNPATFIPAVHAQARVPDLATYMEGMAPEQVQWSDVIARIQAAAPDMPLTVWMNEDTPLLWGTILRRVAGQPASQPLQGEHDLLAAIMQPEGLARFEAYIASHPPPNEVQARRIIGAFLDKYAIQDEIEEELDLPGWDARRVDRLTQAYERDVEKIAAMPGVTFLQA